MANHLIKNATIRKVRNRGSPPCATTMSRASTTAGFTKLGTKWNHAFFPSLGNVRISKADMRYVREL